MIAVRDVGPASWAFSAFAKSRGEKVTLSAQPGERSENDFSPLTGFDRNQPFRRILGMLGTEVPLKRLDPGAVYHFGNQVMIRPAPVEGWIGECLAECPGRGTRDLWESIWNLSASVWSYIDLFGIEPWQPPNLAFPYLNPSFWQGLSRNRLLFANTSDYLEALPIDRKDRLRSWVDTLLRFAYGKGIESTPLGMAAVALNAPAESYRLGEEKDSIRERWLKYSHISREGSDPTNPAPSKAWTVSFEVGQGLQTDATPIHQFFFLTSPIAGLFAQTVVLVTSPPEAGELYVRLEEDSSKETVCAVLGDLQKRLETDLSDWGSIDFLSASPADKMTVEWEGMSHTMGIEADWPWLGQVRSYLSAKRWLETIVKA
jgi:hypothetical protein